MTTIRNKRTLRFKFVVGFGLVVVPLILFMFSNNYYAMNVVRNQVSQSNLNLLAAQVVQNDKTLAQTVSYLLKLGTSDSTFPNLLALSSYLPDSGNYFFAKQSLLQVIEEDRGAFKEVDTFFVYDIKNDALIASTHSYQSTQRYEQILLPYLNDVSGVRFHSWTIARHQDHYYLLRVEKTNIDMYVGALIDIDSLMTDLYVVELNNRLEVLLISGEGVPLTATIWTDSDIRQIEQTLQEPADESYRKFVPSSIGRDYLIVSAPFTEAPIHMVATVPEHELLQQLPYFQLAIYLIPVAGVGIVLIFLLILKQTLLNPMSALISGMRRIMNGNLDVRLNRGISLEFDFLINTFNSMVRRINELKIDVYEEKLKKQEAEFKHLQAQINPHFYLNSLNIIYSLSALRKNELVEKMAEHLADYFRFITGAHREYITLGEEMEHISNYLQIQMLRFPDKLVCSIQLPEEYAACHVPPLTIQPFVENAVIHGMTKGNRPFAIEIVIKASPDDAAAYEAEIADNGKGMAPDKLRELQSGMAAAGAGQGKGGLGIWNVRRRLGMIYGNLAQISFESRPGEGTTVRLRIPVEAEMEGGSDDV